MEWTEPLAVVNVTLPATTSSVQETTPAMCATGVLREI